MPSIDFFRDPPLDGATNMARDEHLLYSSTRHPACLRIYEWSPATLSLGYFQSYGEIEKLPEVVRSLNVVRRSTGGGAILHDHEITYCLILDDSVPLAKRGPADLYRLVHDCWRGVLAQSGIASDLAPDDYPLPTPRTGPFFCFEKPGRTDLLIGGEKVLGSAQRRIPGRLMQHGSLILEKRIPVHPGTDLGGRDRLSIDRWVGEFAFALAKMLSLVLSPTLWLPDELGDVEARIEVHRSVEWLRRR